MPPRQYVPSTWAGHTRSCRSAPIRPMSSWVWTAPGRSTMTTRPVSSAVDRRHGARRRPASPVQAPRVSREQRVEVDAGEVADDHGGGGGGPYVRLVEGAYGRGVDPLDRLLGALARPGHPRGRPGTAPWRAPWRRGGPGWPVSCGISSSRLRTSRSTSLSANAGARSASASSPSALGSRETGTSRRDPDAGVVGVRVEGGAAALQLGGELLGGVLVGALGEGPRHDRGDAVQALRARRPAGASRRTSTATTCWPGRWQRSTVRPLASAPRSGAGKAHGLALAGLRAAGGTPWWRARSLTGRLLVCSSVGVGGSASVLVGRRSARRPAPRGCRGAAGPRRPPGPPRR